MDKDFDRIALQSARYLSGIFSCTLPIKQWKGTAQIPLFLSLQYVWYVMNLYEKDILFAIPKGESPSPSIIKKQLSAVKKYHEGPTAIILPTLLPYQRKRLVEQRISFIVPNRQVFLPDLGIIFQERQPRNITHEAILRPTAAHAIVLMLNQMLPAKASLSEIANALGTTLMSASRISDILETVGLIETIKEGRNRYVIRKYKARELWKHALPLLSSPVKRRLSIHRDRVPSTALEAGYLALSRVSDLAEPSLPEYALSKTDAEPLIKKGMARIISSHDEDEEGHAVIQVWKYPPFRVGNGKIVDPCSLYLSLSLDHDERVAKALKTMMEEQWLKA